MNKFKIINILMCFMACSVIDGQEINQEVYAIADSIASFNRITIDKIDPSGADNKQYDYFIELIESSKTEELVTLFNVHDNAIVKCYAFWGLAKKDYADLFTLLTNNLLDRRYVKLVIGDFVEGIMVSDFLINIMAPDRIDTEAKKMKHEHKEILDSILIFNDEIGLNAKVELLKNYEPKCNQYHKIKELVKNEYSPFAFVALAKFKKEQDLEYIDNLLSNTENEYYALLAIRAFPHEMFYDRLLQMHNATLKAKKINYPKLRALYQALAKYPTEQTVGQFEMALKKTKGFARKTHTQYLWLAIDKYPNSIFNGVKPKLKLSEFEKEDINEEREY